MMRFSLLLLAAATAAAILTTQVTAQLTLVEPVDPDPLSDWGLCSSLSKYALSTLYNNDPNLEGRCICRLHDFVGLFEIDCNFDFCPECHNDNCIMKRETYRYYADKLRLGETIPASFEGSYERFFFQSGPLANDFAEIRIGHLQDGSCEVYLSDLSDAEETTGYPCTCEFNDCNADGTKDGTVAFNCPAFNNGTDYVWGNCESSMDNIVAADLPLSTPFGALNRDLYTFDSCLSGTRRT